MSMPIKTRNQIIKSIKSHPISKEFLELLIDEEARLREVYESSHADEFNRGMLRGVQFVISTLKGA